MPKGQSVSQASASANDASNRKVGWQLAKDRSERELSPVHLVCTVKGADVDVGRVMCAMPMPDEAELLQRARSGSESAFAELFGSQRSHLFRHSYRMLGSGPEADDAVQDALVRAWQRLETFDGRGSFQGWLYRIATNVCLDRLRGRRSKSHPVQYGPASAIGRAMETGGADVEWVQPLGEASANPEEAAMEAEAISLAFVVALQQLPARQRAALLLHDVMGFEPDEVAVGP